MKIVYVASSNPVKQKAAEEGFGMMFPKESFEIRSFNPNAPVSHQPMTDEETLEGATLRAMLIRDLAPDGDYWVGIEGGVVNRPIGMGTFAWVVVLSREQSGQGRSGEFYLPEKVAELVRQGVELGKADDIVFSRNNSKQDNGAIGILTDDVIDRKRLYVPAVVFALIPFKHPELY